MKQPRKQPQPKFFVNNKEYTKEAEALTEVEVLKTAKTAKIVFIDVKQKIETTYTLNRQNYFVDAKVYTPAPSIKSAANSGNDRDNADHLQNLQQTTN